MQQTPHLEFQNGGLNSLKALPDTPGVPASPAKWSNRIDPIGDSAQLGREKAKIGIPELPPARPHPQYGMDTGVSAFLAGTLEGNCTAGPR